MRYYYHCNGCGLKGEADEKEKKNIEYKHRHCSDKIRFFDMVEFHICGDCKSFWPRFSADNKYLGKGWCWNAAQDVSDGHSEEKCFKKRDKTMPVPVLREGEVAQPPTPEPPKKRRR